MWLREGYPNKNHWPFRFREVELKANNHNSFFFKTHCYGNSNGELLYNYDEILSRAITEASMIVDRGYQHEHEQQGPRHNEDQD